MAVCEGFAGGFAWGMRWSKATCKQIDFQCVAGRNTSMKFIAADDKIN
jgi:hypothetical protein